jgi:ElaB/YqjD/DUF883 family membrane-anchored ribosome-binding protein
MEENRDPQEAPDSAEEHAKSAADDFKAAATAKAQEIRRAAEKKAEELRHAAEQKAEEIRHAAEKKAREFSGAAGTAWTDARSKAHTWQTRGESYVRENPTKAIFIALGIGFFVGLMFRK